MKNVIQEYLLEIETQLATQAETESNKDEEETGSSATRTQQKSATKQQIHSSRKALMNSNFELRTDLDKEQTESVIEAQPKNSRLAGKRMLNTLGRLTVFSPHFLFASFASFFFQRVTLCVYSVVEFRRAAVFRRGRDLLVWSSWRRWSPRSLSCQKWLKKEDDRA
ncbi:hypothetical protein A4A49_05851 [Nicotiana attenuata]|uniref:Uncharacterized protein n=1 Tax=Nicotiana attenuata TaxID=49451 RepID=A0A314KXZ0_NICAT|nr:hypothetical protein A4A49_05851 [Nicotiana attenuata]